MSVLCWTVYDAVPAGVTDFVRVYVHRALRLSLTPPYLILHVPVDEPKWAAAIFVLILRDLMMASSMIQQVLVDLFHLVPKQCSGH